MRRRRIAEWVAAEVIAHEGAVRAWLARSRATQEDIDEVIQDAYCRLSMLDSVDHIERADAYFFSIARNLLIRRLKRERVVPIDAIAEIEAVGDERHASPEQETAAKRDYAKMLGFMASLPERCRTIVRLRKIEGWSQRDIAAHLDMTEKAVEKQVWVGVKAIRQAGLVAASRRIDHHQRMVGDDDIGLRRRARGAFDEAFFVMRAAGIDALAAPVGEPGATPITKSPSGSEPLTRGGSVDRGKASFGDA